LINVIGLTKAYGRRVVVDDVTFTCAPGTVTGFLGPNGAGKTTTLKMLLNLVRPTSGSATIGGVHYRSLPQPGRTVGASLDPDGLHPGRTVLETLRLAAHVMGAAPTRVDAVLGEIGLAGERRKTVRACSLGMRQRLSIGVALLGEPDYLILDEPVNGLDPAGIAWIRELLRRQAAAGSTVLLSSHILREVESIADRLVIMDGGRIVVQGTMADLVEARTGVLVAATDLERLQQALAAAAVAHHDEGTSVYAAATPEQIGQLAIDHRIVLTKLVVASADRIESLYFDSTGREFAATERD
jgi:ABC-2 type transport system ATP-binding protein